MSAPSFMQSMSIIRRDMATFRAANPLPKGERYACSVEHGRATLQRVTYQPDGSSCVENLSDPVPVADFPRILSEY